MSTNQDDITTSVDQDVVVLNVRYRAVTDLNYEQFATDLTEQRNRLRGQKVLVDLTQVDYMSLEGLTSLFSFHKKLEQGGGAVVFYGLTERVRESLEVTKLLEQVNVAASRAEARTQIQLV